MRQLRRPIGARFSFYSKTQEKSEKNSYVKPDIKTAGLLTGQASAMSGKLPVSVTEVLFIEKPS